MKDIFDVNGKYGKSNWTCIGTYLFSVVAQIPFTNVNGIYEGPISKAICHADISWVVALILPAVIYYYAMKAKLTAAGELQDIERIHAAK